MRTNTQPDWQRDVEREIGQAAKILGLGDWVVRQFSTAAAFILLGAGVAGGVIGVIVGRLAEQNLSGQALSHSNMVGSIVGILVGVDPVWWTGYGLGFKPPLAPPQRLPR